MKRIFRLTSVTMSIAMVALGLSVSASQLSGAATAKAKPAIKVGMILEQTGIYSAYETEWRQGFNIGLKYATNGTDKVNGQKLDINWDDDADNPTTAVSDFKAYVVLATRSSAVPVTRASPMNSHPGCAEQGSVHLGRGRGRRHHWRQSLHVPFRSSDLSGRANREVLRASPRYRQDHPRARSRLRLRPVLRHRRHERVQESRRHRG